MFPEGLRKTLRPLSSRAATSKTIHVSGSPVRVKALFSFVLLLSLAGALAAESADAQPGIASDGHAADVRPQSVTTTQIAAWLTGGIPSSRLARLAAERG